MSDFGKFSPGNESNRNPNRDLPKAPSNDAPKVSGFGTPDKSKNIADYVPAGKDKKD